ncbi:MAG: ACP phosphodiesterase [Cyclobacteriaceae bacterium]
MNFLAHAYLSGDDKKILLGNFMGDFIKGRQALRKFEARVIRGVELHRAIDAFTDSHGVVDDSKNRLRPKYRHYAGVIVDVFYDHFLATHWKKFHHKPLEDFAAETYQTIDSFSNILPLELKRMLPYMINGNWLVGYSDISGIHRALSGMASRTPYKSKMELASEDLRKHYEEFNNEFEQFFPELKSFADDWIEDMPN